VIPANVVVEKSGIAARLSSIGSWFGGFGIVLRNVSPDEDALDVQVTVNILDAGGRIVKTEVEYFIAIPAGMTYYAGGETIYEGAQPARLEVRTSVRERQKKSIPALPTVQNVRVTEGFLGAELAGEVVNPYTRPLSDLARITFACFDAAGNVIGGGYTFSDADVPPGSRIGFDTFIEGLSAAQIASVQVSVEPEVE
jgi:hypothetical protein